MEPKEQTFNFSSDQAKKELAKWLIALARIPLPRYWAETFLYNIHDLLENPAFVKGKDHTEKQIDYITIFTETGFRVMQGPVYGDDPEGMNGTDFFTINLAPRYHEDVMNYFAFIFCRNNKVEVSLLGEEKELRDFAEKYNIKENMTWQEAYDVLCEFARGEKESIPVCNI